MPLPISEGSRYKIAVPPVTDHPSLFTGRWPLAAGHFFPYTSNRGDSQMISMTPEQAAFLLQYNLPSVKNEYRTTSAIIAAIPTSNADYRPDPQARSAAEIAWHIAAAEQRFYGGIVSGAFDFNNIPRPEGGITPE